MTYLGHFPKKGRLFTSIASPSPATVSLVIEAFRENSFIESEKLLRGNLIDVLGKVKVNVNFTLHRPRSPKEGVQL